MNLTDRELREVRLLAILLNRHGTPKQRLDPYSRALEAIRSGRTIEVDTSQDHYLTDLLGEAPRTPNIKHVLAEQRRAASQRYRRAEQAAWKARDEALYSLPTYHPSEQAI